MPDLGRTETLALPYSRGVKVVNVKYRSLAQKGFKMREGGELRFWNLDAVLVGDRKAVYIFEGEMDGLAAFEAGIGRDKILSVPNGAPKEASDDRLSRIATATSSPASRKGSAPSSASSSPRITTGPAERCGRIW